MPNSSEGANAVSVDEQDIKSNEPNENEESYFQKKIRYVGPKETVAYVAYDMAQSFNINDYSDRFIISILKLNYNYRTLADFINSIWDILNDLFSASLVDKTRTRLGKFRPYLIALSIPGAIGTMIYWLQPVLFHSGGQSAFSKFLVYLVLAIMREGIGTFSGFARDGLLATITPHPIERTRLITVANFFSGFFGEKLPYQITGFLIDLISHNVIKNITMKSLFVFMGVFTTVISSAASLWFFMVSKERVMQSIETPSIKQGFKAILNNKPILLLTLSDILSGISVSGGSKKDYFIDVLHFGTLSDLTGIPGAFVHPVSYALVPWFRKHFPTKILYILGRNIGDILSAPIFFFGIIGGKKNGLYKKVVPMGIAFTLWETIFMIFYGVRNVIPNEMYNEAMDYCEWKNGYRSEAIISAAKGLAKKLSGTLVNVANTQLRRIIGYDQDAFGNGTEQTDNVKFWMFAFLTIFPIFTSIIGSIPILFYDLSGSKRDQMYDELLARRSEQATIATHGNIEDLEEVSRMQKEVGEITRENKIREKEEKRKEKEEKKNK